jgi:hypothetical protein
MGNNVSIFRPLTVLIQRSDVLPLLSLPLIIAGIFLTAVVPFVPISITPWKLLFEFVFFFI